MLSGSFKWCWAREGVLLSPRKGSGLGAGAGAINENASNKLK